MDCGTRLAVSPLPGPPRQRRVPLILLGGGIAFLILLAIGAFFAYRALRQSRELTAHYQAGVAAMEAGDYHTGLLELEWVVQESPDYRDVETRLELAREQVDLADLYAQANALVNSQRWDQAIGALETLRARAPTYEQDLVTGMLFTAYRNDGLNLAEEEVFEEAVARLDQCLALQADGDVEKQKTLAMLYPQGLAALEAGDFTSAIETLDEVYLLDPDYHEVGDRLYQARMDHCAALKEIGQLELALVECQAASELKLGDGPAAADMTEVVRLLTPTATATPTPSPTIRPHTPTATDAPAPTATPTITPAPATRSCRRAKKGLIGFKRQTRCGGTSGAACSNVVIWVMNADGSNQARMCNPQTYYWALKRDRRSNDGTWRLEVGGRQNDIERIWQDGRREFIITNRAADWDPALSADNWWLAWVTNRNGNDEIYIKTLDPADQHQRRLTENDWEWDKHPSWSPDGRKITFYSNRGQTLKQASRQIWVMDIVDDRGVNQKNLSKNPNKVDTDPVWFKWDNMP